MEFSNNNLIIKIKLSRVYSMDFVKWDSCCCGQRAQHSITFIHKVPITRGLLFQRQMIV